MRLSLATLLVLTLAGSATAQRVPTRSDSALIGQILLAEDRRDAASPALRDGAANSDPRIRMLALRAAARIRDPKFLGRDSFPTPTAPPEYNDPAWRLRYRALAAKRNDCVALNTALGDSSWAVRLRAADLPDKACGGNPSFVAALRGWASNPPANTARTRNGVSWQPAAHAIVTLARLSPGDARTLFPHLAESPIPWLRTAAATAAGELADTSALRRLTHDRDPNVQEAAITALGKVAGHAGDQEFLDALSSTGFQAVRAAALALKGSPRAADAVAPLIAAARRLRRDSSETSRDARVALMQRIGEFATRANVTEVAGLANDFDCEVERLASNVARRLTAGITLQSNCTPLPIKLPPDAVALALGRIVRLRVTLADSSGAGSFIVRLRGDVAPIMAARVLALARARYYDGLVWQRVEPDFVIQGGGLGGNEYVGNPRFMRDELGSVPHVRGTVGMSTRGHDTGDGQWFVNLRENRRLDLDYTVFGEVVDGIDVVDGVQAGDVIARIEVIG